MVHQLRRPFVSLATAIALAVGTGGGLGAAVARSASTAGSATSGVFVTRSPTTRPLPDGFLGLALEYRTIPQWVAGGSGPVDPVLVRLIHNLDPVGRPVLRIGGLSGDRSWWPVPHMARPLGITYELSSAWTASARKLAQSIDAKLLLGLNLEADRTRIAHVEANELVDGIGRRFIGALEIGNEPDLYTSTPWFKLRDGHPLPWYSHAGSPVYSRGPGYGPAQFDAELARTLTVVPRLPLAGPDTTTVAWQPSFDRFLSPHSQLRILDAHAYGLNQCVTDPTSPVYPTVPKLLSLAASRGLLDGTAPYVRLAHSDGATFRVDEMGSVTCNGRAGVSDTLASALWVIDALFSADREGIDGVNLHTNPRSVNELFDLTRRHGRWQAVVRPLYYGALMFARAAPPGSRLLGLDSSSSSGSLRTWATRGSDHLVRVLVINDSPSTGASVPVHAPAGYGSHPGSLQRLRGPSAYATGAVTLGGRRFGPETTTGALAAPVPQLVAGRAGTYTVTLGPASAALLTLAPR